MQDENIDVKQDSVTPDESNAAETKSEEQNSKKIDADKTAKQLIDRITKEQSKKNDYKNQLDKALKEIDQLKANGGKSVKQISDEEKHQQEFDDLKKQNKELQAKLQRNETVKEVSNILADNGLSVEDDVLNMIVTNDSEKTAQNAKAIINLVNQSHEEGRNTILKGRTPKVSGNKVKSKDFSQMSIAERVALKRNDPERFREETKKLGY